MAPLTINVVVTVRELDIIRRALLRQHEALHAVHDRQTGDPDPTPMQHEKIGTITLLGRLGWIEPLHDDTQ